RRWRPTRCAPAKGRPSPRRCTDARSAGPVSGQTATVSGACSAGSAASAVTRGRTSSARPARSTPPSGRWPRSGRPGRPGAIVADCPRRAAAAQCRLLQVALLQVAGELADEVLVLARGEVHHRLAVRLRQLDGHVAVLAAERRRAVARGALEAQVLVEEPV